MLFIARTIYDVRESFQDLTLLDIVIILTEDLRLKQKRCIV